MEKVSIHQANVWAHHIRTEVDRMFSKGLDRFDAMLYVETKPVVKALSEIIHSLNQKEELSLDDKHNKQHYSDAMQGLASTMVKVYKETENVISSEVKNIGNENVQSDFSKAVDLHRRLLESKLNKENNKEELQLSR
jgi:hypothetical protein